MNPTRADLIEAARLAKLTVPIDVALSMPALAYCLNQTAIRIAKKRLSTKPVRPDFKKRAAGDYE